MFFYTELYNSARREDRNQFFQKHILTPLRELGKTFPKNIRTSINQIEASLILTRQSLKPNCLTI